MTQHQNFTELGTEPVGKLLMKYAIPAIIAMAASSLYNIIDSIFIGQGVGAIAIAGLTLTSPLMALTAAFGAMVGVGASTLLSVKLGEKDYTSAQLILGNVVTLNVVMGILLGLIMFLLLDPILYFFGASKETIPYARDFMRVILIGNVVTHLYLGLNAMLRSSSKPKQAMFATIGTVLINLILAPLFIYGFHWGIEGAALATILAQTIVLVWQLRLFNNKKELIHLKSGIYKLHSRIVKESLAIGMAPFLINLCACIVVIIVNQAMVKYGGDMAVGAYGIVNRIAFLFIMIVIGINQGMQPIAGYNFGARRYDRLILVLRHACILATGITTLGFIVGTFFAEECARAFTSDTELIRRATEGMHIVFIVFPLIGIQIVTTSFFQSIGQVRKSIFLSLTRQLLFLIPLLLVLPSFFETNGVWISMPISDGAACIVAIILLIKQIRNFKTKILEDERQHVCN
ncbi:MAG: MATE family efflux transporter [Bacteroidaceae bacterium]